MSELDWETVRTVAAVLSALCAIVAASVSVGVWRRARGSEIGARIDAGDRAVRAYAERALADARGTIAGMAEGLEEMRAAISRMEVHQASEEKHVLRPRDLGAIHERINKVAEELAATRAQSGAETRLLSEQLRVLQRLIQDDMRATRRGN